MFYCQSVVILGPVCQNLGIFAEDIVALLGAMTDKCVRELVYGRIKKLSNKQVKFATKI